MTSLRKCRPRNSAGWFPRIRFTLPDQPVTGLRHYPLSDYFDPVTDALTSDEESDSEADGFLASHQSFYLVVSTERSNWLLRYLREAGARLRLIGRDDPGLFHQPLQLYQVDMDSPAVVHADTHD
jgi:hypothetical protein